MRNDNRIIQYFNKRAIVILPKHQLVLVPNISFKVLGLSLVPKLVLDDLRLERGIAKQDPMSPSLGTIHLEMKNFLFHDMNYIPVIPECQSFFLLRI